MGQTKVEKATAITDAKIQYVSLVDAAANKCTFLIKKENDGQAAFTTCGRIVKMDAKTHYVTGVVYEPRSEDAHGNYMEETEITKAAYWFAKNGNGIDIQHNFEPFKGATVVESWIAKADFKIGDESVRQGTWLMTVEIADDKVWKAIEKGEITGFSMGGVGVYSEEDVPLEDVERDVSQSEKKSVFKKLAEWLGLDDAPAGPNEPVEKAGKKMSSANKETLQTAYEALGVLLEAVADSEPDDDGEGEKSEKTTETKSKDDEGGENFDKEDAEVKKEEIEKLVQETVAKAVAKALDEQQSAADPEQQPEAEAVTKEEVQGMVTKAVSEEIALLLKARGIPTAMNDGSAESEQFVEKHYLHGIL